MTKQEQNAKSEDQLKATASNFVLQINAQTKKGNCS